MKNILNIYLVCVLLISSLHSSTWSSEQNQHGYVLKANNKTIYIGKNCDAMSPQYGKGSWHLTDNETVIILDKKDFSFNRDTFFNGNKCQKKSKKDIARKKVNTFLIGANIISELKIPDGKISIYRILNKHDIRKNPDGTLFYKTRLIINITYKNKAQSKELLTDLYTVENTSWNGMKPSLLFDVNKSILTIFLNGKTKSYDYGMEGYAFRFELGSSEWKKEKVFDNANMGWFSFFEGSNNGQPIVWHFSYAGYYAIKSMRSSNGYWSNKKIGNISPKQASSIYNNMDNILIASSTGHQVMMKNSSKSNKTNTALLIGATALVGYGFYKLFTLGTSSSDSNSYKNFSCGSCGAKAMDLVESYVSCKEVLKCRSCGARETNEPPEYWDKEHDCR